MRCSPFSSWCVQYTAVAGVYTTLQYLMCTVSGVYSIWCVHYIAVSGVYTTLQYLVCTAAGVYTTLQYLVCTVHCSSWCVNYTSVSGVYSIWCVQQLVCTLHCSTPPRNWLKHTICRFRIACRVCIALYRQPCWLCVCVCVSMFALRSFTALLCCCEIIVCQYCC